MAVFEWTGSVESGVRKNHALSEKMRFAAIANTKFMQFCKPEPGYGRGKGETITGTRISNIAAPTNARISETNNIPIDTHQESTWTVTVDEWGRGVEYTELSALLSYFDRVDAIQKKLRQQLSLVMDAATATAMKACQIKFIPTSLAGGTLDTDGTPSTAASQNLTVQHVQVVRDYMADSIHVPGWDGGDEFVCLASTKALRGIKGDPLFLAWRQYAKPEDAFFRGEVGMIENIRFVECNHTAALTNNKGTGSVLGEALFFGDDPVIMAVAQDPELRDAIPANFGRFRSVAWYGVMDWVAPWGDSANDGEANIIHVTSS